MTKDITCTFCSMNCKMVATIDGKRINSLKNNSCARGWEFAKKELTTQASHTIQETRASRKMQDEKKDII